MALSSIEALNRDLMALNNQLDALTSSSDSDDETDKSKKLNIIIKKAMESAESDEAYTAFESLYKNLIYLQTEVSRLSSELEKARSEKQRAEEKLEKKRSKVKSLRLRKCEVELETLFRISSEVVAGLDPSDWKSRTGIESVFQKRIDEVKCEAYGAAPDDVEAMIEVGDRMERLEESLREVNADVEQGRASWLTWSEAVEGIGGALAAVCCGIKAINRGGHN